MNRALHHVMSTKELDFLLSLRAEVAAWLDGGKVGLHERHTVVHAPELFRLVCLLSRDADVPPRHKARLTSATVYFMDPTDLIPEDLEGPSAYLDDVVLAASVLDDLARDAGGHVLERHWEGAVAVHRLIDDVIQTSRMTHPMLRERVRRVLG